MLLNLPHVIPLSTTVNEITIALSIDSVMFNWYSRDLNLDKLNYVCEIKLIIPTNHIVSLLLGKKAGPVPIE